MKKGFTLIELLVILSILAILSAGLIPAIHEVFNPITIKQIGEVRWSKVSDTLKGRNVIINRTKETGIITKVIYMKRDDSEKYVVEVKLYSDTQRRYYREQFFLSEIRFIAESPNDQ